ncbi:MAG: cytochrome c oxidase assembly protein [Burkholderiales bacterium]
MMRKLIIVACGMFGFGFALVPFYNKICEVAGINNVAKADAVTNTQVDLTRLITMEFDTNLSNGFPGHLRTW